MTRGNPLSATSSTPSRQKGGEAVFARIYGAATLGLNGHVIAVETDISNGLPSFDLVGLAATSVKESHPSRVRGLNAYPVCHRNGLFIVVSPEDSFLLGRG